MSDQPKPVELPNETFAFSGQGEIYSYTILQDPPEAFADQAPYILALVKLDEGPKVTAQLTDIDGEVAIGDRVEMVTRRLTSEGRQGMIIYGYKFRKLMSTS